MTHSIVEMAKRYNEVMDRFTTHANRVGVVTKSAALEWAALAATISIIASELPGDQGTDLVLKSIKINNRLVELGETISDIGRDTEESIRIGQDICRWIIENLNLGDK